MYGAHATSENSLKVIWDKHANKGFYRVVNAIFGKVGRIASEEMILQLIIIPVLLYGLEACPLVKSEMSSLDFVINRFL